MSSEGLMGHLDTDILDYIRTYAAAHGYPPTRREIMRGVGLASTSTVSYHLHRLADEGRIALSPDGVARGVRVLEPAS